MSGRNKNTRNYLERRAVSSGIPSERSYANYRANAQNWRNADTRKTRYGTGATGEGETMSLKHRIRRIEDKLNAAVKADGEALPRPNIITEYVTTLLDAEGNHIYGGQLCDSVRARAIADGETTYCNRHAGESYEAFKQRALASAPSGRFARLLVMEPAREKAADEVLVG